jgi:tetratricopeptide (TPR) repeat protein
MEMLERLERPNAVEALPENVFALYLAGALYARGVAECWRDDSRALECAERLQKLKLNLYDMSADQVRMMYYANRGDFEQFKKYRERVEMHAIQRGTAWQVETWTFSGLVTVYARTRDAAGLKDCVEQLKRISADMPSLRYAYQRALGAYLVVRGTPSEALDVLGRDERPMELVGWSRGEGLRAAAYNMLGEYERARATCRAALQNLTAEDLTFCALNLGLELELARADAGLGDVDAARERLTKLCAAHEAGANPLTMGALHEALAELAVLREDAQGAKQHLAEVDRWFRQTRDPALVARIERLSRLLSVVEKGAPEADGRRSSSRPPRMMTILHRLRHGGDHTPSGSAEWSLRQLSEFSDVKEGYLFAVEGDHFACVARIGSKQETEARLMEVVSARLATLGSAADTPTCVTDASDDPTRLGIADEMFRLIVLAKDAESEIAGALVVPDGTMIPHMVLQTIAERLASTHTESVPSP